MIPTTDDGSKPFVECSMLLLSGGKGLTLFRVSKHDAKMSPSHSPSHSALEGWGEMIPR